MPNPPLPMVVAAGELLDADTVRRLAAESPLVACCDGAVAQLLALGIEPDVVVGDGDSLPEELKARFGNRFVAVVNQDYNDLTKCVRHVHGLGYGRMLILGGTGRRDDHSVGNISLLLYYLRQGIHCTMLTPYGRFLPCQGECLLATKAGQQVSVFRGNGTGLTATGLRYPLRDFDMAWQGTLNEALGDTVTLSAQGDYLVYLSNEIKQ